MKNNDFIGQMVQETIQEDKEENLNLLSFSHDHYFEVSAFLDQSRSCYIIHNNTKTLEVPKNWGPFRNRITHEFFLTKFDDNELFIEIVSLFFNQKLETIKICIESTELSPLLRAA